MQQARRKVVIYAISVWLLWGTFVLAYDLSILKPKHVTRGPASENETSEIYKPVESDIEKMLEQNTVPEANFFGTSSSYQKPGSSHFQFQSDFIHQYGPTQNQTGFGFTLGGNHVTEK